METPAENKKYTDGNLSPIQKFYANTNIFLTGCTGFLGILIMEKLLVSCPDISKIYVLVRNKKGKSVQTRLNDIFEDAVFCRVREQCTNFRNKIIPVEGDCGLPDLGISVQDRALLIQEVNIVFHVAATVKFDEHIKKATFINVRAVRDILRLAHLMPNLKSFVHLSTAFSNCTHKHIMEKIYPPAIDYKKLLNITEGLPEDILTNITPTLLDQFPNTYSYTKQIGEDVVKQEGKGLPIGIHRPSIVISTYKEPVNGWINNFYGPTGYIAGGGIGIVRCIQLDKKIKTNIVPADMVVNSIVATAWDVAEKFPRIGGNADDVPVYNFEMDKKHQITWENYIKICLKYGLKYEPMKSLWYMFYIACPNRFTYIVLDFFLHKIPAIIVDSVRYCQGKSPILWKVYEKVDKMTYTLDYFKLQEWTFQSENINKLKSKMSDEDRKIYSFELNDLDWEEYLEYHTLGIRLYLLKDPVDTIPAAQKRLRRLYWIHQCTKAVFIIIFLWILWSAFSLLLRFVF